MTNEKFIELVDEIRNASIDTLKKKNANYSTDKDPLRNFHIGGAMIGGTGAQAALGYMAKHLACLVDKVNENDFHDREDLLEKCQDIINYTVFIWCLGNEEMEKYCKMNVSAPNEAYLKQKADFENRLAGTHIGQSSHEAYFNGIHAIVPRPTEEGHRAMEYPD